MKKIGCLLLLQTIVSATYAQNQETAPADTSAKSWLHNELSAVEVISVYANAKSAFTTTDLDKKTIDKKNLGQDIPYLLNHTPSVVISSDAGAGIGYTSMNIRGTDAKRINFTINGVPVNDGESQGTFFVNFPDLLSNSSNIQIQRGVGTSTNGTGAFGASVNIANLATEDQAYLNYQISAGSFNTLRNTLKIGSGKLKNGFSAELRISKINSDGYIARANADLKALQSIVSWENKLKTSKLTFNLFTGVQQTGQAWNGLDSAQIRENRRNNWLGLKEDGTFYQNQNDNYQQDFYQLFYDQKLAKHWNLRTGLFLTRGIGYYDEYKSGQKYSEYGLPNLIVGNDTITKTSLTRQLWLDNYFTGITFAAHHQYNRNEVTIGGAITNYNNQHYGKVTWAYQGIDNNYKWYDLNSQKQDATIYTKYQRLVGDNWYLMGDLQYRFVHYETEGFRKTPNLKVAETYHFFNPKMGLSHVKQTGTYQRKSYVSFAVANKEPNRDDFETGNAPKHETLYNIELGTGKTQKNKFEYSANIYYMYYRNQLINDGKINDVGAYTRFNVPESYRLGLELSGYYALTEQLKATGNVTFSRNKITEFTAYYDDYDNGGQIAVAHKNTDIAFSPNFIASLGLQYQIIKKVQVEVLGKAVGRAYLDNTQDASKSLKPYQTFDCNIYYNIINKKSIGINAKFSLMNFTNLMYENNGYTFSYMYDQKLVTENYYFPQAGINFLVGLQFNIK